MSNDMAEFNAQVAAAGGIETIAVTAVELDGEDREAVWEAQKAEWPQFAEYEANTERTIPVVELRPR